MGIVVDIDVQLPRRTTSVGDFVHGVGLSAADVSVLENGSAKAIRSSTPEAIYRVPDCQPADTPRCEADEPDTRRDIDDTGDDRPCATHSERASENSVPRG